MRKNAERPAIRRYCAATRKIFRLRHRERADARPVSGRFAYIYPPPTLKGKPPSALHRRAARSERFTPPVLGEEKIRQALFDAKALPLEDCASLLVDRVHQWTGNRQDDDLTLIVIDIHS
jgi:hypothetical protein